MNAIPVSPEFELEDNNGHESDGDINDDQTTTDYYQPISAVDDSDTDNDAGPDSTSQSEHPNLPNGYFSMDNGVSSLRLSDAGIDHKSTTEEDESSEDDEVEEEEDSDAAIQRAFRQDESRRAAPLTVENAARVMEAMRGVRFSGSAPDWAQDVPEDQWLTRLQSLREPPSN